MKEGKKRGIPTGANVEEYKAVNARESKELADAFLSYKFLDVSLSTRRSSRKHMDLYMLKRLILNVKSSQFY